jgi:CheY-like chemotaxis protein
MSKILQLSSRYGLKKIELIVAIFNDSLEALSKFKVGMYDILILDIRMPGMNGFQLYQRTRDRQQSKGLFLIAFNEYRV